MHSVSIIGLGYIGLPTAAMFASHGVKVYGVDVSESICKRVNAGDVHIEEPFLADIVKQSVQAGRLCAGTSIRKSDNFIIAVPTPITSNKGADLTHVVSAAQAISSVLEKGNLVILESTVSPRFTVDVLIPTLEESGLRGGTDFYIAHCPERVLPGNILYELKYNDRIIGGVSHESAMKAKELYSLFVEAEMYITDSTTAELCKLMENTYRDVNIALANELAMISERLGTNAWDIITYANKHPRVNLHQPGPGVGGHCLAVDPWFVVESTPDVAKIIALARETNDNMPQYIASKVKGLVNRGEKVVVLGCTYKPDIDDIRESPIMHLVEALQEAYHVVIVDPYVEPYKLDIYEACKDAHLIILGVNHSQFKSVDFGTLGPVVRRKVLLDTRNFFGRSEVEDSGFTYVLLGDRSLASERGALREVAATKNAWRS